MHPQPPVVRRAWRADRETAKQCRGDVVPMAFEGFCVVEHIVLVPRSPVEGRSR